DDYATELPIIQGHEAAGVITEVNSDEFAVGDRAAIMPMFYCGKCYACSIGRVNACKEMCVYGCYQDGPRVTSHNVPVEILYTIPNFLSLNLAPLTQHLYIPRQV